MVNGNGLWIPPGAELGHKTFEPEILQRSVTDANPDMPMQSSGAGGSFLLWAVSGASSPFPDWGTAPKTRDALLRNFWHTEPFMAGAISTIAARNSAMEWKVTGSSRLADAGAEMLRNANNGLGWESLMAQVTLDLLTQDNGAFIEFVREDPNRAESPVIGLNHLDSQRCWQTGVPETPVIYEDANHRLHPLRWFQIVHLLEMPSPYTFPMLGTFWRLQYCLDGDATVRMADGRTERISKVVRDRDEGPVLALDATGQMSPARITNWYTNPRNGREWINLRGLLSSVGRGNKRRNSWMTADHPVLTPDGWRDAGAIVSGDPIVTEFSAPNEQQMAFIIGTMLGDASMPAAHIRPRMTIGHKVAHREWVEIKARVLEPFGAIVRESGPVVSCDTKAQPAFVHIRDAFYDGGRKRVPRALVERHFSPALLAAWYLDDGHLTNRSRATGLRPQWPQARARADIGCSGLTWDDAEWLAELLTNHGYAANVLRQGGASDGPRLFFSTDGTAALLRDIGRYIPTSLRYKADAEAEPYDMGAWEFGPAQRFIDEAVVERDPNRGGETVYCIDVEESHNFVTAGIVVHNCAVTRVLQYVRTMAAIGDYDEEKISGRFVRAVHLLSGITTQEINDAMVKARAAADSEGLLRYMQPVMVGAINPDAKVGHDTIPLASLPENWDLDKHNKWYLIALALGLLTDVQEFMPLPGGNLGTSAQSETLHLKAKGKGQGLFQQLISRMVNLHGALPQGVNFEWDETDLEADKQVADAGKLRAEARKTDIDSGVLTPEAARQLALEAGDLSQELFDALKAQEDQLRQEREAAAAQALAAARQERQPAEPRSRGTMPTESVAEGEDAQGMKATGTVGFGTLLSSRLHRAYSMTADDASALGYFPNLEDRLAVAESIGPALKVFEGLLREAGVWDLPVRPEDADRLMESSLKALSEERAGPDEARLEFENDVAEEIGSALGKVRSELNRRLTTLAESVPGAHEL